MGMRTDAINETPKDYDFSSSATLDEYEMIVPTFEDWADTELRSWLEHLGEVEGLEDADSSTLRSRALDVGLESGSFFPAMHYAYPLPRADALEAADTLAKLQTCLAVVEIYNGMNGEAEPHLVLTGGGMNLSWEICEAYIACGYHPPVHFCDLPAMAGRADDTATLAELERDQATIAACLESLRIAGVWIAGSEASVRARFEL